MMLDTGLVDVRWFLAHTMYFDGLTFSQQIAIMSESDILVSVQAAALLNGAFMREGSAVVSLFNARFSEFFLGPPINQAVRHFKDALLKIMGFKKLFTFFFQISKM